MKPKCPCFDCPETGCGKHSQCEAYMKYFTETQEWNDKRVAQREVRDYTIKAIAKQKSGRFCTANRYRPKGRW